MDAERDGRGWIEALEAFAAGERGHVDGEASELCVLLRRGAGADGAPDLDRILSDVRREELAALLRHACHRALNDAQQGKWLVRSRNADGSVWRRDDAGWERRRRALVEGDAREAARLRLLAPEPGADPASAKELAIAALRLIEEPIARIYLAYAEIQEGHPLRGRDIAAGMLARGLSARMETEAWIATAFAQCAAGRLHDGLTCYRNAAETGLLGCVPSFLWLIAATWLSVRSEAEDAAWRFADSITDAAEVDRLVADWSAAHGSPRGFAAASSDLADLEGRIPAESWRVVETALRYAK